MSIKVSFYSYFKELTGCSTTVETVAEDTLISDLVASVLQRFPRLAPMRKSMLVAVGVEYQGPEYVLKPGDEVSLFPPVQGG